MGFASFSAAKIANLSKGILFRHGHVVRYRHQKGNETMKELVKEFMDFIKKHQVLGLAVAFVIGTASTKLVTAIVNDLVMPIVGAIIPGGDWRASVWQVGPVKWLIGDFVGALIDFLIIALVVFVVVKFLIREDATKK